MPSVSYTHTGWDLGGWRFGEGGLAGRGVSESAAPQCGWAPFWTELGIKIRLRLLGSSRLITRASRAGYRACMLFHFGGWKRALYNKPGGSESRG